MFVTVIGMPIAAFISSRFTGIELISFGGENYRIETGDLQTAQQHTRDQPDQDRLLNSTPVTSPTRIAL